MGRLTGKFSNLTAYVSDPVVSLTICGLIVIGGIGFPVIQELYRYRQTRRLSLHSRLALKVTAILITLGTVLILLFELGNPATMKPLGWGGASWPHSSSPSPRARPGSTRSISAP